MCAGVGKCIAHVLVSSNIHNHVKYIAYHVVYLSVLRCVEKLLTPLQIVTDIGRDDVLEYSATDHVYNMS